MAFGGKTLWHLAEIHPFGPLKEKLAILASKILMNHSLENKN